MSRGQAPDSLPVIPETRYVAVGDGDVAYQVLGDGPRDLLYFVGLGSHIDLQWDSPTLAPYLRRLASFSRLILFDRRGSGASDPITHDAIPGWEGWSEDVLAVLNAASSHRAAILAEWDAGPIALLFAAMHPDRVDALVLGNTTARYLTADDYPIGLPRGSVDAVVRTIREGWGVEEAVRRYNPEMAAADPEYARRVAMTFRAAATPRTAATQYRYILENLDVRAALPSIRVPTLVLHNADNQLVPASHGRYLAEHIQSASYVELQGRRVGLDATDPQVVDEIAQLLTGERAAAADGDRILTTVLFTDIVQSTDRAVVTGDRQWRTLLDAHDRIIREQLRRFRGREVNTTGDGFIAAFDGPARAIHCAQAITAAVQNLGIEVRAGLHTGECEMRGEDLAGLAVHIAARIAAIAAPSQVLVSRTVVDIVVGSDLRFQERGRFDLKGVPERWQLFSVLV